MKKIFVTTLILITAFSFARAGSNDGTSTASFLRLEQGARALGMGGAFVAVDKDIECAWWNPGAMSFMDSVQVHASYSKYLSDISGSYAAFSVPVGEDKSSTLFGNVNYFSLGTIDARDASGNAISSLSLYDVAGGLGYSFPLAANISFGLSAKYIQQSFGNDKGTGFALDTGILLKMNEKLALGISAQNLGQKIETAGVENQLPTDIRAGISYQPSQSFLLDVDGEMPNDADSRIHFGAELKVSDTLYLRSGYNTASGSGLSFGIGFLTPVVFKKGGSENPWWKEAVDRDWSHNVLRIDYAYVSQGDLDATHRISASLKF